jgi:hypothetical protein
MSNIQEAHGVQHSPILQWPIEIATAPDKQFGYCSLLLILEAQLAAWKGPRGFFICQGRKVPGTKQQSHNGPCMAAAARSNRASKNSIEVTREDIEQGGSFGYGISTQKTLTSIGLVDIWMRGVRIQMEREHSSGWYTHCVIILTGVSGLMDSQNFRDNKGRW